MIECISAVTLPTEDMARAVAFYTALGFVLKRGGPKARFSSFGAGVSYLNLTMTDGGPPGAWRGRTIFYVGSVDALFNRALAAGMKPTFAPRDAAWGERYFHISDPDGHELSFARPL